MVFCVGEFVSGVLSRIIVFQLKKTQCYAKKTTVPLANGGYAFKMKIDKGTVLVTEGRRVWISLDDQKLLCRIVDFPFTINDLWLQRGRLMILGEKALMSCDLRDNDRKVHISANQMAKSLPIFQEDREMFFFAGGTGKNDDEAILFNGGQASAIGSYSIAEHKYNRLTTLPQVYRQMDLFSVTRSADNCGNYLYSWAAGPDCMAQIEILFSAADGQFRVIGSRGSDFFETAWNAIPDDWGMKWCPWHNISGELEYNGRYLLYSGRRGGWDRNQLSGSAGIVDLDQYPSGISLQYPAVNGLYFHPDGQSLWAVEYYQVTKIRPAV